MEYEKKYKEALKWVQKLYPSFEGWVKEDAEHYFPELKSEDEKIRKAIHIYLDWLDGRKDYQPKGAYTIKDMIAWLEKQGEQPTKIEPKLKVDDWVVSNNDGGVWQIGARYTKEGQRIYLYNVNDVIMPITLDELNNDYHLWTINDAKDGDVLAINWNEDDDSWEKIIIFKKYHNKGVKGIYSMPCVEGYGNTFKNGKLAFQEEVPYYSKTWTDNLHPATKEQRDLLFSKMHDAGYTWDSENKKLKKIEVKTLDADKVIEWLKTKVYDDSTYGRAMIEQFEKAMKGDQDND